MLCDMRKSIASTFQISRSPAMMIGLTVSLCHLLLVPYTGCSVNPARSLGPAIIQRNFKVSSRKLMG